MKETIIIGIVAIVLILIRNLLIKEYQKHKQDRK